MEPFYAAGQPQPYAYVYEIPRTHRLRLSTMALLALAAGIALLSVAAYRTMGFTQKVDASRGGGPRSVATTLAAETPTTSGPIHAKPPQPDYGALSLAVQNWVQSQPTGQWGVVVQDLSNPQNRVEVNAGQQFYAASLYKLFLTIPLAAKLPFSAWQTQHTLNGHGQHTIAECVQAMLAQSDNACGEAVGDYVGWVNVNRTAQKVGFSGTALATSDLRTTPADMAKFLTGLAAGQWFDAPAHNFIMASLAAQKYRSGIPAGCPECTVYNKTGELNGVAHDAAIVTHGNQRYVLVAMSQGGSDAQIADLSKLVSSRL